MDLLQISSNDRYERECGVFHRVVGRDSDLPRAWGHAKVHMPKGIFDSPDDAIRYLLAPVVSR